MKCSTELKKEAEKTSAGEAKLLVENWAGVEKQLGLDLAGSALQTKAFERQREIRNAGDLLRLILFYALSDWSLRLVGSWAFLVGIGYLSDVAVLKRIRKSRAWIGRLIYELLKKRCSALMQIPGVRLRILDATTVSKAGSTGADWRAHMCFDLGSGCIDGIELTDGYGGESLVRFEPQAGEIRIVDGGYPSAKGMGPLLAQGAGLIVRINWRNVAVRTPDNQRFDILAWLKGVTGQAEQWIDLQTPQGWFSLRLLASQLPADKAEVAKRKVKLRTENKGHTISQETLFAAGFVLLLTNLPCQGWTTKLVFAIYRLRWQIELVFKRLKSLLHFDNLGTKTSQLAQTWLLAKLLAALVIDDMNHQVSLWQPDWFASLERPVSIARLTQFHLDIFSQFVCGPWSLRTLQHRLIALRRYFCDPPRARPQQLAWGRALSVHLAFSFPSSYV